MLNAVTLSETKLKLRFAIYNVKNITITSDALYGYPLLLLVVLYETNFAPYQNPKL